MQNYLALRKSTEETQSHWELISARSIILERKAEKFGIQSKYLFVWIKVLDETKQQFVVNLINIDQTKKPRIRKAWSNVNESRHVKIGEERKNTERTRRRNQALIRVTNNTASA